MMSHCIETHRALNREGYGVCSVLRHGRKINRAHVLAWVDHHERLPGDGMQINHHCDNRACINLEHLYEGTQQQNVADMIARGRKVNGYSLKTRCKHGHAFDEANTSLTRQGYRICRTCHRERAVTHYYRKKAS